MPLRIEHRVQLDERLAVRLVVDALPLLVLDDVTLAVELALSQRRQEKAHAVRLEVQRQFQCVRGHVDDVVGPILGCRSVIVAARRFEQVVERALGHVLRALEHDVLEKMREAGSSRLLPPGTDVIPDVDRRDGNRLVLVEDHVEPVGERELRVGDAQRSRGGGVMRRGRLGLDERRFECRGEDHQREEEPYSHLRILARFGITSKNQRCERQTF